MKIDLRGYAFYPYPEFRKKTAFQINGKAVFDLFVLVRLFYFL